MSTVLENVQEFGKFSRSVFQINGLVPPGAAHTLKSEQYRGKHGPHARMTLRLVNCSKSLLGRVLVAGTVCSPLSAEPPGSPPEAGTTRHVH